MQLIDTAVSVYQLTSSCPSHTLKESCSLVPHFRYFVSPGSCQHIAVQAPASMGEAGGLIILRFGRSHQPDLAGRAGGQPGLAAVLAHVARCAAAPAAARSLCQVSALRAWHLHLHVVAHYGHTEHENRR